MASILLTGATGYIASHTWLALLSAGHSVIGVDDYSNSSPEVLKRIALLSGIDPVFVKANVCNEVALDGIFAAHRIDAVIHFAAFKAVAESTAKPLAYYRNNLVGLISVCDAMQRYQCKRFVFSSSATVYGVPKELPITESSPLSATSPYGQTKLMSEAVLRDIEVSDPEWQTACLRYFNPVGAHPSGLIGEDPNGIPNNLMPYVAQVAVGRRAFLQVFGSDYETSDGTGVRDYIHVSDLAAGHVAALNRLFNTGGSFTVNLGTGRGYSVLEVVAAYSRASQREIPYRLAPRRAGDVPQCYADARLAKTYMDWSAQFDLEQMCIDSWRWQQMNPTGYSSK